TAGRRVVHALRMPDARLANYYRVRFTPDGQQVVSALDDELRVWDVKTGDELIRLKVPAQNRLLAVSPDGKTGAFGACDVFLWRCKTGEEPKKFAAIGNAGMELAVFAMDGRSLYVQPRDASPLRVYDLATGRLTARFDLGGMPRSLSLSPDGKTLAVGYAET